MFADDEDAALAAALKASLMDAIASTNPNHVPKLEPRPRAKAVFRAEAFGFAEGAGFIRQVKIMDQWSPAFKDSIAEFHTPAAICGYVVAAVSEALAEMFPKAVMTSDEVACMLDAVSSEEALLPRIRRFMQVVHDDRQRYIAAHPEEFNEAQRKHYVRDWVANYELSDAVKLLKNPAVHFLRHCERDDDVEHEEARRVGVEAPFRELVVFVEAGQDDGSSLLLRPSEWVARRRGDTDETKAEGAGTGDGTAAETPAAAPREEAKASSTGAACEAEEAEILAKYPLLRGTCPVWMTDCLGHFVVTRPVLLRGTDADGKATVTPTLLLLNSMGGDFTLHVAVTALFRMVFGGASETSDPLFLFATHHPDA